MYALELADAMLFLSTLSLRRATFSGSAWVQEFPISIHALLAESDMTMMRMTRTMSPFLSTLSLRRATLLSTQNNRNFAISIHALLAESDPINLSDIPPNLISIHALLAESDSKSAQNSGALLRI